MRKTRAVEVDGDRLFETSPEKEASVVATAHYAPKDRFGFPDWTAYRVSSCLHEGDCCEVAHGHTERRN